MIALWLLAVAASFMVLAIVQELFPLGMRAANV